ncbi:MAG: VWA domain-containing protein [Verrucomicrobiota bacterium]
MTGWVFQWPAMFWLLLLVAAAGWLVARAGRERRRVMESLGRRSGPPLRWRDVLRLSALALLVLALARPGHSPRSEATSLTGRDVVFALDVSRSMLAEDLPPSRLEAAKQAIRDALATFDQERVGLVIFAGSASILCPLTYDYDFVRYMLEQAQPRSVEFGGTHLQAAVEKVLDQVFLAGRAGVQDLVVLTDGGDHGSEMTRVASLLRESESEVLLVGLGDPEQGSPIPILDEEGQAVLLEAEGRLVETRLEEGPLRWLAEEVPRARYAGVGTRPFHLGSLYQEEASGKPVQATAQEAGQLVYQEAAGFFLVPALCLLLLTEGRGRLGFRWWGRGMLLMGWSWAPLKSRAEEPFRSAFEAAVLKMEAGQYEVASSDFAQLYAQSASRAQPAQLAAMQLNLGLSLLKLSQAQAGENPVLALAHAEQAQRAFLSAKRYAPEGVRAGARLEASAQVVAALRQQLAAQEQAEEALQERLQALVERLQVLWQAQGALRQETLAADGERGRPRPQRNAPPAVPPENAPALSLKFQQEQASLRAAGESLQEEMGAIDAALAGSSLGGLPGMETLLQEPLELMGRAVAAQTRAEGQLAGWGSWPAARGEQLLAERALQAILDLLGGNQSSQGEGEEEEWEDYEEDYDYADEDSESQSSSQPSSGDLAMGAEMQELPVPNYSVEDILAEEEGNLQFRQQERAKASAGQVEKDY